LPYSMCAVIYKNGIVYHGITIFGEVYVIGTCDDGNQFTRACRFRYFGRPRVEHVVVKQHVRVTALIRRCTIVMYAACTLQSSFILQTFKACVLRTVVPRFNLASSIHFVTQNCRDGIYNKCA